MTSTHYLNIDSAEFRELAQGRQHALCVAKEQGVAVGDQLVLRECKLPDGQRASRAAHSGIWMMRRVTAALEGVGIAKTHAVYSLNTGADNERAVVAMKRQLGLAEQQGVTSDRYFRHQSRREAARRDVLRRSAEVVARVRGSNEPGASSGADPSQ